MRRHARIPIYRDLDRGQALRANWPETVRRLPKKPKLEVTEIHGYDPETSNEMCLFCQRDPGNPYSVSPCGQYATHLVLISNQWLMPVCKGHAEVIEANLEPVHGEEVL